MDTDRTGYCRILSPESKICVLTTDFHSTAPPSASLWRVCIIFSANRFKAVFHHLPYLKIVVNKKNIKTRYFLCHTPKTLPNPQFPPARIPACLRQGPSYLCAYKALFWPFFCPFCAFFTFSWLFSLVLFVPFCGYISL